MTVFCSTDIMHLNKMLMQFCSIPVRLTTPVAGCSDYFMCSPPANYVSSKQHQQTGAEQAGGNIPCFTVVAVVLLWMVFVAQSLCMLCKYNMEASWCGRQWKVTGLQTHQSLMKVLHHTNKTV